MKKETIKYEWKDAVFDNQTWFDVFEPKLKTMFQKKIIDNIDKKVLDEYNKTYKLLIDAKENYIKKHNEFLYGLIIFLIPFGFLLFIYPGIVLYRKFKKLQLNKNNLKTNLHSISEQIKSIKYTLSKQIKSFKILENKFLNEELKYKTMGPINRTLIEQIKSLSMFNLNNTLHFNTLSTNWGVFNNNIVINYKTKFHELKTKTYTGTKTIFKTYKNHNGEIRTISKTITVSYTHPCPYYIDQNQLWCFSEYCDNLEFNFLKYYGKNVFLKKRKNKNQSELENSEFEQYYKWVWNDDVQIRMVFTPYMQEQYLKMTDKKNPSWYLRFKKIKSFFGVERENEKTLLYNSCYNDGFIHEFNLDPFCSLENWYKLMYQKIYDSVFNWYQSLSFMTLIPVIQSENQVSLINNILSNIEENEILTCHYLINVILEENLFNLDTPTMHYFEPNFDSHKMNNITIKKFQSFAFSYKTHNKVTTITTYEPGYGPVLIDVDYIDYEKQNKKGYFIYTTCDSNKTLFWDMKEFNSNFKNENQVKNIINDIKNIVNTNKIVIRNGYLVFFAKNDFSLNQITNLINELLNLPTCL